MCNLEDQKLHLEMKYIQCTYHKQSHSNICTKGSILRNIVMNPESSNILICMSIRHYLIWYALSRSKYCRKYMMNMLHKEIHMQSMLYLTTW